VFFGRVGLGEDIPVARQAVGLAAERSVLLSADAATVWRPFFCECGLLRWRECRPAALCWWK